MPRARHDSASVRDRLRQLYDPARHACAVERCLCPDEVDDVRHAHADALDGPGELFVLCREVSGEGEQERHRLASLWIGLQVPGQVILVLLHDTREGLQTAQPPVLVQLAMEGPDPDRHAVDRVADVVDDGLFRPLILTTKVTR